MKKLMLMVLLSCLSVFCGYSKTGLPAHIEAAIASGDTIPDPQAPYMVNLFLINGTVITPGMYEKGRFVLPCNIGYTGVPDSELYMVLDNGKRVVTGNKKAISILFPDADKYIVDGTKVKVSDFNRIPVALISEVSSEDSGKTIVITTRKSAQEQSITVNDALQEETALIHKIGPRPLAPSDLVINDFSTYPDTITVNIGYLLQSMQTLRDIPADEIRSITLTTYAGRPVVNVSRTDNGEKVPEATFKVPTLAELFDNTFVYLAISYSNGKITDVIKLPKATYDQIDGKWDQIDSMGINPFE